MRQNSINLNQNILKKNKYFFLPSLIFLLIALAIFITKEKGASLQYFNENHNPYLDFFFKYGTKLGEEPTYFVIGIICLFVRIRLTLFIGLVGLCVTSLSYGLKTFFAMKRPLMYYSELGLQTQFNYVEGVHVVTGLTSFPSGHTMSAFAIFGFLALVIPKKKCAAFALFLAALTTGLSRIYLVQHFLNDVIFGAFLGMALALGLYYLYKKYPLSPQHFLEKPLVKIKAIAALFLFPFLANAQIDTSLTIDAVEIKATKNLDYDFGSNVQNLDSQLISLYTNQSLATLLQQNSGIFIKSYGLGSLATVTTRGSAAGHTPVFWNGFNLQNSMNGVVDFSLMPAAQTESVKIQYGGGSSVLGSGAIGGAIFLDNSPEWGSGVKLKLNSTYGSFNAFSNSMKLGFGKEKFYSNFFVSHHNAENDFKLSKKNDFRQSNAEINQINLGQNNFWKIGNRQILKTFLWYQNSDRAIPPSRTEAMSDARQEDEALRAALEWNFWKGNSQTVLKAAYIQEDLLFYSSLIDSSFSEMKAFIAKAQEILFLKKEQKLVLGFDMNLQNANARLINGTEKRQQYALNAGYEALYFQKKMKWAIQIRGAMVDNEIIPFTASSGLLFHLNQHFKINANISKDYNLPTFNDLYWEDVFARGNENLEPESGWSEEIGLEFSKHFEKFDWNSKINFFNSNYQNWILWVINDQGVYQPENKRAVWARGIEASAEARTQFGEMDLKAGVRYHFTKSTIQKVKDEDASEQIGKQLIYTPLHILKGNLSLEYQKFALQYHHQYTSIRHTTRDNNDIFAVPAYQLGDLSLAYHFSIQNANASCQISINNMWNVEYEVIEARPMPLRNFQIGIMLNI